MELTIRLENPLEEGVLFGSGDMHLKMIRDTMDVRLFARDGQIRITGPASNVSRAAAVIEQLQKAVQNKSELTPGAVTNAIRRAAEADDKAGDRVLDVYGESRVVRPKTPGQNRYIAAMSDCDMVFCAGPAGTGKTYLAVAFAVHMLKHQQARRLILVRPAVEAGEKLGFLPGDMQAKVNPYLRPLFDALGDMMAYEQIRRFMDNDMIEVIPLAFMRGRTLNDSVIILDEAQNTTVPQMLMFLTRMGNGSKVIVTGDDSQIDLPPDVPSGLLDAKRRLGGIEGLAVLRMDRADIVRHRLVQNIVDAYAEKQGLGISERQKQQQRQSTTIRP